jgi:uncharacterized protein
MESADERTRRELTAWLMSLYRRGLRRAGIDPDVPDDIRQLGPRLGRLQGIQRVVLFGSWARGEAKPDSDVDLLVIDAPNCDRSRRYVEVRRHLGRFGRPIDLIVVTPEEFEREQALGGLVSDVLVEGVVLYDN